MAIHNPVTTKSFDYNSSHHASIRNMYKELFTYQTEVLKALSHRWRLEIVQLLRDRELPVTDIYSMLHLEQASVSKHLAKLHAAGVVSRRRDGRKQYYSLRHPHIIQMIDLLREMLIELHSDDVISEELRVTMQELTPLVKDPICGMRLSPKTASYSLEEDGKRIYFCASGCMEKYASQDTVTE